ncbi:MAG: hypothetical protein U5N56_11935 [Candidatus Marinimicrobia bacterium]|nr:hypothetical protein [Candidatus Neomarinimicrobiota bacterium]
MTYRFQMVNRVLLLILLSAVFLNAQDLFEAKVYVQGSDNDEPMFIYTNAEDTVEGKIILGHYYHYTNGELFASEELFLDEEKKWEKHVADFPFLDERSEMLRQGRQGRIKIYKKRQDQNADPRPGDATALRTGPAILSERKS